MNENKAPTWFNVVAVIALLWNLLGVMAFFFINFMMSPEMIAAMPEGDRADAETQLALLEATPMWATIGFACAVFGGLLGSLFLLLKKNLAIVLFAISLIGLVVQNAYAYLVAAEANLGGAAMIQSVLVFVIAVFLLWLALKAKNQGWSR